MDNKQAVIVELEAQLQNTAPIPKSDELVLINMADVETQEVTWLWYPYIPAGKLTILQGDPGGGKTTFTLQLASIITTGGVFPTGGGLLKADIGNVLFQTAEDGLADTIKPRLEQAKADCSKVSVIDDGNKALTLTDERIEQAIVKTKAKLFIIDPLQAYLGADKDMHRANEVRPVMEKLKHISEKTGCAILLICHMNKGNAKGLYRGLGSIDIPAAARSVLVLGHDPNNSDIRAVVQIKSNLAHEGKAIAFELSEASGFLWRGESELTAEDILDTTRIKNYTENVSLEEAKSILLELFGEEEEWQANEIQKALHSAGVSERSCKAAKKELNIISYSKGYGVNKKWYWRMNSLDGQNTIIHENSVLLKDKPSNANDSVYKNGVPLRED